MPSKEKSETEEVPSKSKKKPSKVEKNSESPKAEVETEPAPKEKKKAPKEKKKAPKEKEQAPKEKEQAPKEKEQAVKQSTKEKSRSEVSEAELPDSEDLQSTSEPKESTDSKDDKGFACSGCKTKKPASEFSNKQMKLKGKRKCNDCVAPKAGSGSGAPYQGEIVSLKSGLFADHKSKSIVKEVSADAVKKAQERMAKGDEMNPDTDKFDRLIQWLKEGGAKFPNLLLKFYTVDYRGVHARRRLEANELILEVPLPLIMTTEVAKDSDIGVKIQKSGCTPFSDHSWLAALLLQEKYNPKSFYKPYIDCLPVHYRNMPLFFDDEELKWLKGSFTLKMIEDRKYSLKTEFDNIVKFVPEFGKYHHLDFFWARIAVITRVFGFEVKGHKTEGLVAMADMLNHKRPNETSWTFDDSRNAFTITTTKRLLKSAQIFDSYGRKCNSRFFVNYGFSLDVNEDNQVAVFFDIPKDDPNYTLKTKLLRGTSTRRFQIAFEHKERCTKKCVSFLRIALATLDELAPLLKKQQDYTIIDPINPSNELKVMAMIAKAAEETLKGFDTSLEEDNKLLNSGKDLTMNLRNCVVMRRGEKEILHAYIDLNNHLQKPECQDAKRIGKYLAKHIKGRGPEPSIDWRMEKYFEEFWVPLLNGKKIELEEMNNSLGE